MSAMEPLCLLAGIDPKRFSKEKRLLLEAEFFSRIYKKLEDNFRKQYTNYFNLFRFTLNREDIALEENFVRSLIQNMLSSGDYTVQGIARYTNTPEDVLMEIIVGLNPYPSAIFLRRLIELDRAQRRDFYHTLVKESLNEEELDS
ncbi:MAG: hypothetical protein A3F11_04525 [Gammaproteobacteria bacterium RIFCSPHIGHO2_12_FULL_37_14]|nr:MAG: hypothetical protein A3F11_04525 [Gammaproteobacteria bacterium RIFCSPHIGHO2_12_FULL_37_14]